MTSSQSFPVERSSVDIRSPALEDARSKWGPILEEFEERLKEVSSEGSIASCSRHQHRGQLLRAHSLVVSFMFMMMRLMLLFISARDRIALLLDFDSPFLELGPFAGHKLPNSNNCANIIAGVGIVRSVQPHGFFALGLEDVPSHG